MGGPLIYPGQFKIGRSIFAGFTFEGVSALTVVEMEAWRHINAIIDPMITQIDPIDVFGRFGSAWAQSFGQA